MGMLFVAIYSKFSDEWFDGARLRPRKKARRWQNSLTGHHQIQLSVPTSHRGSLASLDDLHVFHRSRSMCSIQLDTKLETMSLNMELFSSPSGKSSDDGVWLIFYFQLRHTLHFLTLFSASKFKSQLNESDYQLPPF
jgi:hypothetical protein